VSKSYNKQLWLVPSANFAQWMQFFWLILLINNVPLKLIILNDNVTMILINVSFLNFFHVILSSG